jgi:hypothetical protein
MDSHIISRENRADAALTTRDALVKEGSPKMAIRRLQQEPAMDITLWALSSEGGFLTFSFTNTALAQRVGNSMVAAGAWRTWDAFETLSGDTTIARLIVSCAAAP